MPIFAGVTICDFNHLYACMFVICLYSPSVLDRLNCLLEPGGYLSVDEKGVVGGSIPIVYPHPQFRYSINILKLGMHLHSIGRLFLTMDPIHGELSRAMRNRGTEIYMLPSVSLRIKSLELTNMIECAFRTVPWMSSYTKKIYFR